MKARIIAAQPLMDKTTYAKNNSNIAIDLESSNYMFIRQPNQMDIPSEQFKGLLNRTLNPNGVNDYVERIIKEYNSEKWSYIFISMHPDVIIELLKLGLIVEFVKPHVTDKALEIYEQRAKNRGNNTTWWATIAKYFGLNPLNRYPDIYHNQIIVTYIPEQWYLSDYLD